MPNTLKILGIPGSLRKASLNLGLLRAARELAPEGTSVEIFALEGIPPFNQDDESRLPARIVELKTKVREADALIFATPEYNYSVPGVLKNAIDWGSRPYGDNVWTGKPVAIMGASPGSLGTARAQYHLRQTLVCLDMHPLNKPEVLIGQAAAKFDAAGNLTDEDTRKHIRKLLDALAAWTRQLGRAQS